MITFLELVDNLKIIDSFSKMIIRAKNEQSRMAEKVRSLNQMRIMNININ